MAAPSALNSCGAVGQRWRVSGEVVVAARSPGGMGTARHHAFLLRLCLTSKHQLCGKAGSETLHPEPGHELQDTAPAEESPREGWCI